MRAAAAALFLLLLSIVTSLAQAPVNVIGAVTPGHCVSFFSTSQIQDSGGTCGGGGGGGIVGPGVSTVGDLAVWNNATGTALADTNLSFPGGFSFAGTLTGATAVTFPTSGTLATTANANVASVTGTAGQITVTPTTGAVVVSLPSTITANLTLSGTINNTGVAQLNGVPFGTFATQNFATPPAIGGTTPAAGAFTTLSATGNLTTNITGGGTQCLQASNTGVVSGTGGVCGAGGGTPGGANTNVQFNNSSAFGGDAGFTYTTPGQVTVALGTITTNNKALNITGTWNAVGTTFDAPLFMNITNTASAAASTLFDFQAGGVSQLILQPATNTILSMGDGAAATALRVYNTVDTLSNPTNYDRGVFDWTTAANTLTIATQKGGTGASRSIAINATSGITMVANGVTYITLQNNNTGIIGNVLAFNATQGLTLHQNAFPGWVNSGGPTGTTDLNLVRRAAGVLGIHTSAAQGNAGWFNYGGQARVTADFSVTSSIALTNVTGLSVSLQAGRTYTFQAQLYVTDAAAGGVQAAIAGTATATAINYTGYTLADNAIKAKTNATALGTAVGSSLTTETSGIIVGISGTITVNAAGTLTVQMAQNTSNATPTIAKQGSWFVVQDMP